MRNTGDRVLRCSRSLRKKMKKEIKYKDWKFEVDFNRTKEIYRKVEMGSPEGCVCNDCKNFSANRENIYPIEFKKILGELGIDYKKESETCHYCKLENGKHFYGGWFHFKGKIVEGKDCKISHPNGGSSFESIPINEDFKIAFMKGSDLSFFDKEESKDLIQIEFLANSDWVIEKELESE
jgi:hypothetical protein